MSDPKTMSTTEAWLWVDDYHSKRASSTKEQSAVNVCKGATSNALPTETIRRLEKYGYREYHSSDEKALDDGVGGLPTFLHFCQNYDLAGHSFAKRKIKHDFFRCNGEPLKFDVATLMKELTSIENDASLSGNEKKKQIRAGFMLCHLIPLMNMALDDYKQDVC